MLSLVIILLLLGGFFVGLRRGLILQLIHLTGFIVSIIVAYLFYKDLAGYIRLWIPYPKMSSDGVIALLTETINFESVYYNAIAFGILFIGTKIVMHMIGAMLDFVAHLPILRTINGWLGGLLASVEVYLLIFVLLHIAVIIPIEIIQSTIESSTMANGMMNHTPILSDLIKGFWTSV